MNHLTPGGIGTPAPGRLSTLAALAAPLHRILAATIDRTRLEAGIASRRDQLAQLEAWIVADCEAAAAKVAPRTARLDDRDSWTTPMWDRYVTAAARLDPTVGRRLHRLSREIQQLQRLLDLFGTPSRHPGTRVAQDTGETHAAA
jgi:hypothetical protein